MVQLARAAFRRRRLLSAQTILNCIFKIAITFMILASESLCLQLKIFAVI